MPITPTYIPLGTITLSSTASTVTFSSIPATYRDLIIIFNGSSSSGTVGAGVRLNSDAGSNYPSVVMAGNTIPPFSGAITASSLPMTQAFGITAPQRGFSMMQIMDYSATDKHKTSLTRSSVDDRVPLAHASRWANTTAVNTLTVVAFNSSFAVGTTISLYGVN